MKESISILISVFIIQKFFTFSDLFSNLKNLKKGTKRGKNVFKPAEDWGPYLQQHRGERYADMQEPTEKLNFRFLKKI